jgi:hypothetical protein
MLKTVSARQLFSPAFVQQYLGQNQRISCFYILIFGTVAVIFLGTILFELMINRTDVSAEKPSFTFYDIEIDSNHLYSKKVIPYNYSLGDIHQNINWRDKIHKFLTQVSPHFQNRSVCANHWGVAVDVTESVLRTRKQLSNWCIVVVVGDQQYTGRVGGNIFFLNKTVRYQLAEISAFYKESLLLPNDLYAVLKNLGYLWAIFHQATTIWDFDNIDGAVLNTSALQLSLNEKVETLKILNYNSTLFNPYAFYIQKPSLVWSRGYPFRSIFVSILSSIITIIKKLHDMYMKTAAQ